MPELNENKNSPEEQESSLSPEEKSEGDEGKSAKRITRRQALAVLGVGAGGMALGSLLATWGVTSQSIAEGRIAIRMTPTKMIVTDRARCSGCQRCEMMCTLKNDGRACQHIARVQVSRNYNFGHGVDTLDGTFENFQFSVESCKQCNDAACMNYCPVHAIYSSEKTGTRLVDEERCIACGMCSAACPWNMPVVDTVTHVSKKCVSCGRCAQQCPNGAIKFIDWQDIAEVALAQGTVSTFGLVGNAV